MSDKITYKDHASGWQEVFYEGQLAGSVKIDGTVFSFDPIEGLHHKRRAVIEKAILERVFEEDEEDSELQGGESASRLAHNQETEGSIPSPATTSVAFTTTPSYAAKTKVPTIPDSDPEPARGELGDIAPDLIEWRKRNWPMDAFSELYPPHRLKALNREDLI